jgi:peptidyl-tRNA hydrolase, PTH1 family
MHIIALQNTGSQYKKTRHNAGSIVLQNIVSDIGGKFELNKSLQSFITETFVDDKKFNFYLLDTFVNLSGSIVAKIIKKENIETKNLIVIFDDVSVPLGEFRISREVGGSSHNGIKSIIESVKANDFTRIRIGIGQRLSDGSAWRPEPREMSEYVLSDFTGDELEVLRNISGKVLESIKNL